MQYRLFGQTGKRLSAVGFGANRFPRQELECDKGLERCADLVVHAADLGVNFFDSATAYSHGKCEEIMRRALPRMQGTRYICGKSSSHQEKTADAVLVHIRASLEAMGLDYFNFYYMWSIKSLVQYDTIMAPGGPYEGLVKAREQGLVQHICFSCHAPVQDALRIIGDGAFEGVLLSYNLLNARENTPLLAAAEQQQMGVSVMNPLGGGIIPQNPALFGSAVLPRDTGIVDAALKAVYAHPAVTSVLCGVTSAEELDADVQSLSEADPHASTRLEQVSKYQPAVTSFCTGCGYCAGCPSGLPVSTLMSAYNQTKFEAAGSIYNCGDDETNRRIAFFRPLNNDALFETGENPCLGCGKCEIACPQHLPIIGTIAEIYSWAEESGVSLDAKKRRLDALLNRGYRRVGFYTAGGSTAYVLQLYRRFFCEFPFEVFVFDSNPQRWGTNYEQGYTVKSPKEISALGLDILVITSYVAGDEIYNGLTKTLANVSIQKLHAKGDLPWLF